MRSIVIAFAMYSKIPMPQVAWDKRSLSWALCAFPLVGVVIGAALYGWLRLADFLGFTALKAAAAIPPWVRMPTPTRDNLVRVP